MGQPYVGEIRMFGGNFAPVGWAFCDGQPLPISQFETLFNLIGTTYGGDGESTFNVPNLNGRAPLHQGGLNGITYIIGQAAGVESVTLTTQQIPSHNHQVIATSNISNQTDVANNVPAQSSTGKLYQEDTPDVSLSNLVIGPIGGNQPHENMQPYLCVSFIISLFGIFPSQT